MIFSYHFLPISMLEEPKKDAILHLIYGLHCPQGV